MLQFDQESQPARRGALGVSGAAGGAAGVLDELAREIEDTQRQQSETMAHIVGRLRTIETVRPRASASPAARRQYMALDESGDEPWDSETAEVLMQTYEADDARGQRVRSEGMSKSQQDWIGERFNDVTQRITQALTDLKPGGTMAVLEERLDAFQTLISTALKDVVRRDDLDGIRLIELHVNDLGDKLDELERHVARIDGIESDVRNVIEQVSDQRIAKLLDYDSRFAADLEAVARRAAEEVHSRLAPDDRQATANSRHHEELRALIEASIQDRREAEVHAVSQLTGLSGRVSAQADRYDELKGLLEQAIQEQRQNEQTAFGMLDTLQQALVTVLDRMDVLEQQHAAPAPVAFVTAPALDEPQAFTALDIPAAPEHDSEFAAEPTAPGAAPYAFRDTRFDGFGADNEPSPVEVPTAFAEPGAPESLTPDEPESPLDRLRRDFVADARRAKMKAAANRAEALGEEKADPPKAGSIAQARAALTQATRPLTAPSSGKVFGMSTKLLAGVLALIIAINGGLLLFNRKSRTAPQIAHPTATAPQDTTGASPQSPPAQDGATPAQPTAPGPRSDLDSAPRTLNFAPYGFHDDVLDPPEVETLGNAMPDAPRGTTVAEEGPAPVAAVADVYEQQVLASLSGKLGAIAAGQSADALLPEKGGRVDASYPAPDVNPGNEGAQSANTLDLPPATVGPLSLRMAAANGDASAEFEVAARLAEGKGTSQNYAEALQWYQRSAAKGFAQAQYRLGTLYERGLGVKKDLERAKVWYQRAAENGNVKSMHNLAVLSAGGEQGEPNYAAAAPWFQKAAEYGLSDSQYNLGVLVENGLGVKADRVSAYKWYALAAKDGDQDATQRRDALKVTLSGDELKAAEGLIAAFRARVSSPLSNDARAAGEDWKKRVNDDTNT